MYENIKNIKNRKNESESPTKYLTLHYTGYFGTRWTRVFKPIQRQFSKLFLCSRRKGHPCDQMYIEIVPNQTFLTELQGSKVDGGGTQCPPPCKVGLRVTFATVITIFIFNLITKDSYLFMIYLYFDLYFYSSYNTVISQLVIQFSKKIHKWQGI